MSIGKAKFGLMDKIGKTMKSNIDINTFFSQSMKISIKENKDMYCQVFSQIPNYLFFFGSQLNKILNYQFA